LACCTRRPGKLLARKYFFGGRYESLGAFTAACMVVVVVVAVGLVMQLAGVGQHEERPERYNPRTSTKKAPS
jgi:hypothetical protein